VIYYECTSFPNLTTPEAGTDEAAVRDESEWLE